MKKIMKTLRYGRAILCCAMTMALFSACLSVNNDKPVLPEEPTETAYDFSAVSPSGHTLYYNIDGSHVKVVSELGDVFFSDVYETLPTGDLVIPESVTHDGVTYPVTTIGYCAFLNCLGLTSVSIPVTVTTIESGALAGCSGIKNLVVPATVTFIDSNAFRDVRHVEYNGPATDDYKWNALSLNGVVDGNFAYPDESKTQLDACLDTDADGTVTIPASVKVISRYAFIDLHSLVSIDVPNTVDSIGVGAFYGCENLVSATLPEGLRMIDAYLFCDCTSLKSFVVPDSVKRIRLFAFLNCSALSEVTFGYSTEKIVARSFRNCKNLKKIHSLAPVAPEFLNGDPFENVPKDEVVVTVPSGSIDSYREKWACFSNIKEEFKGIVINLDSIVIKPYMQFGTSLADVEKYMNKNYADWTYIKEEQGEGVRFSTAYNKGNEIIVFTYNNIPAGSLCAVTYGFYYSEVSFPAVKAELERNGFMYQGKLNFENPEGADEYQMFLNADKSIEVQFARWNNSWAIGFQVFDEDDMNYLVPAN